jgi:hypothetical protein
MIVTKDSIEPEATGKYAIYDDDNKQIATVTNVFLFDARHWITDTLAVDWTSLKRALTGYKLELIEAKD